MSILNSSLLFRQISMWSKPFMYELRNTNLNIFSVKCIKSNTKVKIALYHNRVISKFKPQDSLSKKIVGSWLLTCSGMVFIAVTLGGVTRLTESGLSMVTWKLFGEKMPINEASWLNEFEKYKKFPEFKITNKNMTLEEFKQIWWMEYIHRMWGRLIGVMFIVPASYFYIRNMLDSSVKKKILILGALIGCQGFMGWYMVKSGLEKEFDGPSDVPRVSQYRLAAHLGLAFTIYSGFLYAALDHLIPIKKYAINSFNSSGPQLNVKQLRRFRLLAYTSKGLIFLTAMSGAFVAGLDAGLIYNSFPKMSNKWIPDDIFFMTPIFKNFAENPAAVQFNHRILGILTLSFVTYIGLLSRKYKLSKRASVATMAVLGTAYLQVTLGIVTLINYVPIHLAALHQSGSLLLLSAVVWLCHEIKYIKKLPK